MASRIKSAGDGKASDSASQTGSPVSSAEALITPEQLRQRPWSLGGRLVDGEKAGDTYLNATSYGSALATLFLRGVREDIESPDTGEPFGPALGWLLLAMAGEEVNVSRLTENQKGQLVGFATALRPWIFAAVKHFGSKLGEQTDDAILTSLNDALSGGPMQRYDAKMKALASEQARAAANARWAKHRAQEAANV